MRYLSLDVGTSCCKGQLFDEKGDILEYRVKTFPLRTEHGASYVNLSAIWSGIRSIVTEISSRHLVDTICLSTIGESFVLLDEQDEILFDPMLYTDPRGQEEASEIRHRFGEEWLFSVCGIVPQGMLSLSKLLWIRKNCPERFARARKILLMCDYFGYLLTGKRCIDEALASRTGAFDLHRRSFSAEILQEVNLALEWFSVPGVAGSVVGPVRDSIRKEWGLKGDAVVILGSHDQICSALGAGALHAGDAVDGMGTVECMTALFSSLPEQADMGKAGYACVPYPANGLYATYCWNYTCGSAVRWLTERIFGRKPGPALFEDLESRMKEGPTGILILPYLQGAATPYQDDGAKGMICNLDLDTSDADLYRAWMEGTAMEMRWNAETVAAYHIPVKSAVVTGGCSESSRWLSIKADIQKIPMRTIRSHEGGLCGCAMLQAMATGQVADWETAAKIFVRPEREFLPDPVRAEQYEKFYQKYKKMYPMWKEWNER